MDIIKVERQDGQVKAKQLRRCGFIPCCVYGGNLTESVSLKMSLQAADQLCRTKRVGSKVNLDLEGMPAETILTVDDIPEFRNERVEVQIKRDSMVLRISDKKRAQSIHTES